MHEHLAARPKNREYDLCLYVAGSTRKSAAALRNLERLCEEHLAGRYHIEIIDLMTDPHLAQRDQILAVPTLVRKTAGPIRKIVGNLSNTELVLTSLGFRPEDADLFLPAARPGHV